MNGFSSLDIVYNLRSNYVCLVCVQGMIVQVLSEIVSKALDQIGRNEASETAHFVSMVDKFFTALTLQVLILKRKYELFTQ